MEATATELKNNLGYYLKLVQSEDIRIMRNGRYVAKLVNPKAERIEKATALFGIGKAEVDLYDIREERRSRFEGIA